MTNNSAVPADVTKQKEDAHKLLAEFEKGQAGNPGEAPAPQASAEPQKAGEGTPAAAEPAPEPALDAQTLAKQVEQLMTTISELQAFIADENRDTWKQKFSVIDGKYRAEIQPAAAKIKELEGENHRLKTEIETARAAKPAVDEALTDEDRAIMEDMAISEATYRRMMKRLKPEAKAQDKPVEPAQAPAKEPEKAAEPAAEAQPAADPARTAYFTQLDVKAPGWREAVVKPEFAKFLNEMRESVGGVPGRTLMEVLTEADANNKADMVSRVYKAYFALAAQAKEKPSREAAPSSSKGGSGTPVEGETWSLERIQKFENDVAKGAIKMGSEEYKTLKASRDHYLETHGM